MKTLTGFYDPLITLTAQRGQCDETGKKKNTNTKPKQYIRGQKDRGASSERSSGIGTIHLHLPLLLPERHMKWTSLLFSRFLWSQKRGSALKKWNPLWLCVSFCATAELHLLSYWVITLKPIGAFQKTGHECNALTERVLLCDSQLPLMQITLLTTTTTTTTTTKIFSIIKKINIKYS